MAGRGFGRLAAEHLRLVADLFERDRFAVVNAAHALALEHDVLRLAAEHPGRDRADALFELGAGFLHRFAGHIGRRGRIRARIIRRSVGVRAEHGDVVHAAVQALGGHLGQDRVAAGAHVRRADDQVIGAVLAQLDRRRTDVDARNAGPLHRHGHARGAHLAVAHVAHRVFFIPVENAAAVLHAAVQRAGVGHLAVIGGHRHALAHHVFVAQHSRVHVQLFGQLVDDGLQRIDALGRAVAAVSPGRLVVRVHNVIAEPVRLQPARVQRDGLVARKPDRRRPVLAVSAGVGKRVQVDAADAPVVVRAQADAHLHLVARRTGDLRLLARVDQLGGPPGLHGHKRRVHLAHGGLLGAETAADARFFHADAALGQAQRLRQDAPHMEHDLGRGNNMQPPVAVQLGIGAEGLHHRLVEGPGVVGTVQHDIAAGQHGFHIAVAVDFAGDKVAAVVAAHRAGRVPVLLGVDQNGVVLGGAEIEHRLEHFVFDLDKAHRLERGFLGLGGDDGHRVARKPHMAVQNQPVIG